MEFGYFTLSDNHYPDGTRSANQFVLDIREQCIHADQLGMHSTWIGEHHFDRLGVNSRPGTLLGRAGWLLDSRSTCRAPPWIASAALPSRLFILLPRA